MTDGQTDRQTESIVDNNRLLGQQKRSTEKETGYTVHAVEYRVAEFGAIYLVCYQLALLGFAFITDAGDTSLSWMILPTSLL